LFTILRLPPSRGGGRGRWGERGGEREKLTKILEIEGTHGKEIKADYIGVRR